MLFEKFRRKKKEQKEAIVEKDKIKVEEIVNKASDSNENDFEVDVQEIGNEELKNKRLVEITDKNILVHINHLIPSLFKVGKLFPLSHLFTVTKATPINLANSICDKRSFFLKHLIASQYFM